MSLAALLGQLAIVTPRTPGAEDEYGDPQLDDGVTSSYPCRLEQGGSYETTVGEDRVVTSSRAFLPPSAVIGHLDAVHIDGIAFEVMGTPDVEVSPQGPHHLKVALREIQGG